MWVSTTSSAVLRGPRGLVVSLFPSCAAAATAAALRLPVTLSPWSRQLSADAGDCARFSSTVALALEVAQCDMRYAKVLTRYAKVLTRYAKVLTRYVKVPKRYAKVLTRYANVLAR